MVSQWPCRSRPGACCRNNHVIGEFASPGHTYGTVPVDVEVGQVWTSCPTVPPRPRPPGCATTPAPRSSSETGPRLHPFHELPRTQIIERIRHRQAHIRKLISTGWTLSATTRRLHLDRKTGAMYGQAPFAPLRPGSHSG
ncbi:hypothetical protein EDD98_7419 [Streptomyces sp. PanSC19]|nr:hypothetical protein EDD98_7419 [Streptomyces sp. PanSC19]